MRVLIVLMLTIPVAISCAAQDITVYVVNDNTQKAVKGIDIDLRVDCEIRADQGP